MGEMVIVMVIFLIILGFGLVFYLQYARDRTETTVNTVQQANLAETAKLVGSLPELRCSLAGDEKLTCLDLYRVQAFAGLVNAGREQLHYSETFHGFRAELVCIYPQPCSDEGISDYTLFDYTETGDQYAEFIVPVVIENPAGGTSGFGLLRITQVIV